MKEKLINILKVSGVKNVAILSSGVLFAQIIGFIVQPIATRLYTPQDMGIMVIITSVVTMFSSVLNGEYDLCIVTARTDDEADKVTAVAFHFGFIVSIIVSVGILIINALSPSTFGEAGKWIYVAIPLIFASGITNVLVSYNNRYGYYKLLSTVNLYSAVVSNVVKLGLGLAKFGVLGLVISWTIAIIVGLIKQSEFLLTRIKQILSYKKSELLSVAFQYKAQPLFSAPGIFVVSISYSIIPFFINSLYGIKEVGYFSLSVAMLGLPLSLVSTNAGKVFLKNASREKAGKGNFYNSFKSTTILLSVLSIVPFVLLWFLAEPLFSSIFGQVWLRSGTFVKLLLPMYWMRFIVTALVNALVISGRQIIKLIIQICLLLEAYIVYFITEHLSLPIEVFLTLINYAYMMNYFVILLLVYFISRQTENNINVERSWG